MSAKPTQPVYVGWYDPHDVGRKLTDYTGADENGVVLPSMTKQSFKDECDINNILSQYKQSGMVIHINAQAAQGRFLDLPDQVDFQEAANLVIQAQDAFAALPAKIRDRFHNDPAEFLAFVEDPANGDELVELGLREPPPRPEPGGPAPAPGVGGEPPAPAAAPAAK